MCPVILLSLILCLLLVAFEVTAALTVTFNPSPAILRERQELNVTFNISSPDLYVNNDSGPQYYQIVVKNPDIASLKGETLIPITSSYEGLITVVGEFLGQTKLHLVPANKSNNSPSLSTESNGLDIIVKRNQSMISTIFTISVATLVSLNYINMGCALDLGVIKSVLTKPIAPFVGFASQYLIMPIASFFLGLWLLNDQTHLRLGLFIFGCSPAGGASNMWTVLLNGNLDLSVTMTFISTIAGVGMLPLWMYTLGRQVYSGTNAKVPFSNILGTLVSMAVFLGIGLLFQKYLPRVARVSIRHTNIVSSLLYDETSQVNNILFFSLN